METGRWRNPTELAPEYWVDHHAGDKAMASTGGWLRAVRAIGEVVFESGRGAPPPERLAWLCYELADFLTHISARSRWTFRLSLWTVTWLAPILVLRPTPIDRLAPQMRAKALARFEASWLGLALFAVKAVLCIIYYEHPQAAREIGFDGRCLTHPGQEAAP